MSGKIKAKKSLGQHYLTDQNIAEKIVSAIDPDSSQTVIEIGPGMGALTRLLIQKDQINLHLVEIDSKSVEFLKHNFPEIEDRIIQEDFLKSDLKKKFNKPITIIGNFPYNISSQIFFKILENRELVECVVCMIQREVADRIRSAPGSRVYGITSVLIQAFYNIEFLFPVNETVFLPPPKVKSSVIRLRRNETEKLQCNEELFYKVVKAGFNHRRKTLRNSLRTILLNLDLNHPWMSRRPEQLSVEEFVELTRMVEIKMENELP